MKRGKRPRYLRRTLRDRWNGRPRTPAGAWSLLMALTLCKAGRHCPPGKRIRKFGNGNCPLLCCHCRLITGHW